MDTRAFVLRSLLCDGHNSTARAEQKRQCTLVPAGDGGALRPRGARGAVGAIVALVDGAVLKATLPAGVGVVVLAVSVVQACAAVPAA